LHIWLLALAWEAQHHPAQRSTPLRLFWVVDRRVVVDQATAEAEALVQRLESEASLGSLREALRRLSAAGEKDETVAVSTLRGARADNRAWSRDPSRPAIVVGTVDMIGSRLLFSGYGDSRRRRAHHAGLMAQDSLIVNDESHLTPAFARLLEQVAALNAGERGLRVMFLSATPRDQTGTAFGIPTPAGTGNPVFLRRYHAVKYLHLVEAGNVTDKIRRLACAPERRTVVFVRSPEDARALAAAVSKANPGAPVFLLTGLQRGKERDELLLRPGMEAFLRRDVAPAGEPCWLVATSAGEVGVDLSCDRLITDLDTAEHILQRVGRLNRFGETEGHAYVVYNPSKSASKRAQSSLEATLAYLRTLPDLSPAT
jgi:CRISPR-associated endonuclease/helicase Cas3